MFFKGLKGVFANTGGQEPIVDISVDKLADLAARRAENFFREHRLSCSEAALLVVNHGFAGGLTTAQALGLGSGFGGGMGNSGCVCGALSGAVMVLGLFLGPACKNGLGTRKFRKLVGRFHDSFREESGTVCCRDLIVDFKKDRKGQALFCRGLTGRCTSAAVRIILQERPGLTGAANLDFLQGHDSGIAAAVQKLLGHELEGG